MTDFTSQPDFGIAASNTLFAERNIVPLFHRKPGSRFELVGSAVYVSGLNLHFLITAKHVFEGYEGIMVRTGPSNINALPVTAVSVSRNDEVDIAVVLLRNALSENTPVTIDRMINTDTAKGIPNRLVLTGFPSTASKTTTTQIRAEVQRILTMEIEPSAVPNLKINPKVSIAVGFDRKNILSRTRPRPTFPKPNGMSGGGLYWMHISGLLRQAPCFLAGILTEWDSTSESGMKATKIKFPLAIMKQRFGVPIPERLIAGIEAKMGNIAQ